MITVYTAQEHSKTLILKYRNHKCAKEDFSCTWFINRDKNMEWYAHEGTHTDPEDMRVCVMLGYSEPFTDQLLQVLSDLLARITNCDQSKLSQIKYGTTKINKQLEGVPERILQNIRIGRMSIA